MTRLVVKALTIFCRSVFRRSVFWLAVFCLSLTLATAKADTLYEYRDESGQRHFVNSLEKVPEHLKGSIEQNADSYPHISRYASSDTAKVTSQIRKSGDYLNTALRSKSLWILLGVSVFALGFIAFLPKTPRILKKTLGISLILLAVWASGLISLPKSLSRYTPADDNVWQEEIAALSAHIQNKEFSEATPLAMKLRDKAETLRKLEPERYVEALLLVSCLYEARGDAQTAKAVHARALALQPETKRNCP